MNRPTEPAPWHPPRHLMERYASGRLDPVQLMSLEAHVARCEPCRAAVPVDEAWLAESWALIEDQVDRPRVRTAERLLHRVGVPEHLARFLVATPGLSRAWLLSVAVVLLFAVVAANMASKEPRGILPFLVLAPVLPLAGISAAYGPRIDPVHELQAATPMAGPRSLLLRSVAVLASAVVMAGLATPFLPGAPGLGAAWLLPSLALTVAALMLSTLLPVAASMALLAACWLGAVTAFAGLTGDLFVPFHPIAQLVYGCAALILIPLLYVRRRRLDPGDRRWSSQQSA